MRNFGYISIIIIISSTLVWVDNLVGDKFLSHFVENSMLGIMATLLALNMATTTFLLGQMAIIELKKKKSIFVKTRNEIRKDNTLLFILIALAFIIQLLTFDGLSIEDPDWMFKCNFCISVINVSILISFFLVLFDTSRAVLKFSKSISDSFSE